VNRRVETLARFSCRAFESGAVRKDRYPEDAT
jgi:hypothetical protein